MILFDIFLNWLFLYKCIILKLFYLINNPEAWFEYRRQRNITSHAYDETKAHHVYQTALVFFQDAFDLLQNLKQKNE